jgi:hypothetical protein
MLQQRVTAGFPTADKRSAPNKVKLTDMFVTSVKPQERAFLVWGTIQRGLALSVQPSGSRAWKFIYRFDGKPRWLSVGNASVIGLADARRRAGKAMLKVAEGIDPQDVRHNLQQRVAQKALAFIEQDLAPACYLYRHYHPNGNLLYVGISLAPLGRQNQICVLASHDIAHRDRAIRDAGGSSCG